VHEARTELADIDDSSGEVFSSGRSQLLMSTVRSHNALDFPRFRTVRFHIAAPNSEPSDASPHARFPGRRRFRHRLPKRVPRRTRAPLATSRGNRSGAQRGADETGHTYTTFSGRRCSVWRRVSLFLSFLPFAWYLAICCSELALSLCRSSSRGPCYFIIVPSRSRSALDRLAQKIATHSGVGRRGERVRLLLRQDVGTSSAGKANRSRGRTPSPTAIGAALTGGGGTRGARSGDSASTGNSRRRRRPCLPCFPLGGARWRGERDGPAPAHRRRSEPTERLTARHT
jgi:hypothetical protein